MAPWFGIYGIIAATAICFIVIMLMNLIVLKKTVSYTFFGQDWYRLALAALILIGLGMGMDSLMHAYFIVSTSLITYGIHAILLGTMILFVYPFLLFKLRLITETQINQLPTRIQKIVWKLKKLVLC